MDKNFELRLEMRAIQQLDRDLKTYNNKIEGYNEKLSKRVDTDLHLFSVQTAELRKPLPEIEQKLDRALQAV